MADIALLSHAAAIRQLPLLLDAYADTAIIFFFSPLLLPLRYFLFSALSRFRHAAALMPLRHPPPLRHAAIASYAAMMMLPLR